MPRRRLDQPNYRLNLRRGRYAVEWTDVATGATRSISTGTVERTEAEIWRDQWLAGRAQPAPPPESRMEEILLAYQADRLKAKIASPGTLKYALVPIFRHIANLQPHMLASRAYMNARLTEGVKDNTIRREVAIIRAALAWAVREEWIGRAPYIATPPAGAPRDRWLTREEIDRLIAAAHFHHLRLFIVLAYHTAARMGAILDLTWDRVDLEYRKISYDRPGRSATNKRRAVVPINLPAFVELQAARELATIDHVIEWRGKSIRAVKKAFQDACRRAGIEDCSPHILRHTSATHMVMASVPLAEVARFLGDTEAMVEKVYGKHSPDYLRRAADALAGPGGPRQNTTLLGKRLF